MMEPGAPITPQLSNRAGRLLHVGGHLPEYGPGIEVASITPLDDGRTVVNGLDGNGHAVSVTLPPDVRVDLRDVDADAPDTGPVDPVPFSAERDGVRRLLESIDGEDVTRDGLADTPMRVAKALHEMTAGYAVDVAGILATTFDHDGAGGLIISKGIPFASLCEHHMLPFIGTATVGYVPLGGSIVGLSKLARTVDAFARRLQVHERLTAQIADAIDVHLRPLGVGVVIEAEHTCQSIRGVRKAAPMVTSELRGMLRERPDLRAEFLALAGY
jgi:GTP cyclohydrolase I